MGRWKSIFLFTTTNGSVSCSIVSLISASSQRLQSLSMTSVDLCAMYKPWDVQEDVVTTIMDEFWQEV
jgi:hypothetical protein